MKQNETPQLSSAWWKSAQPDGLSTARELADALADYEAAHRELEKKPTEELGSLCLRTLDAIKSAARSAAAEAHKLAKAPPRKGDIDAEDLRATAEVLGKMPRVIESAETMIEKALAERDASTADRVDDDHAGALGSFEDYRNYLKTVLRRMKQMQMNFAIGLGSRPEEHRFICHRTAPAFGLSTLLKSKTRLNRLAWGVAGAHGENATTLTLALESPPAPGLKRKLEAQLKLLKPLPFDKVMLMVDGEEADDLPDPAEFVAHDGKVDAAQREATEPDATSAAQTSVTAAPPPPTDPSEQFAARLKNLLARLPQAIAADAAQGDAAKHKASEAGNRLRHGDFAGAGALLGEAETIIQALTTPSSVRPATTGNRTLFTQSRLAWDSARHKVQTELAKLESEIRATYRERGNVFDDIETPVRRLDAILATFDEALGDKLDEALNAADGDAHDKAHDEAREIIHRYRQFLDTDPLLQGIDGNPFVEVSVHSTLDRTLSLLESRLSSARS